MCGGTCCACTPACRGRGSRRRDSLGSHQHLYCLRRRGGIKISITKDGFSVCGELGFGIGTQVAVDPVGGLDPNSTGVVVEAGAGIGIIGGSAKAEIVYADDCGDGQRRRRRTSEKKGCIGPFCATTGGDGTVEGEFDQLRKAATEAFKPKKFGVSAKVTGKVCGGTL